MAELRKRVVEDFIASGLKAHRRSAPRLARRLVTPVPGADRRAASHRAFGSVADLLLISSLLILPFLLVLFPGSLSAQEVKGVAVEAGRGTPIEGAFVSLVDESGDRAAAGLTSSSGAFLLHVFVPGQYRLRVERIGYETWESEAFEAGPPRQVARRLEVLVQPVQLADLQVAVASRCDPRPGAEEVLRVWEEVRKALDVVRWGEAEGDLRFQGRLWQRELDLRAQRVRREEVREAEWRGRSAFRALPAEELAAGGLAQRQERGRYRFYGPDARTLLSDEFQETHCFWLVRGEEERAGQLGVAFRPAQRGRAPDVEGVLWVEEETAELRELEYRYTDLGLVGLPRGDLSAGWAEFRNLASGEWLLSRWWIRMPMLRQRWVRGHRRVEVFALQEAGGEVTEVGLPGGETLALGEWGTVVGTVEDGLSGGPLAGAEVALAGTEHVARTDERGRFRLEPVPPGRYGALARHPEPLLEGLTSPETEVEVRGGSISRVSLSFPDSWAVAQLCGEEAVEGQGALLGRVGDAETGEPVSEAVVWVWPSEGEFAEEGALAPLAGLPEPAVGVERAVRAVRADSRGAFLICGLPAGEALTVQVSAEGRLGEAETLEVPAGGLALRKLTASKALLTAVRVALEERARRGDETVTVFRGVVRSVETGEPVAAARVRILGTEREVVTGEDGTFLVVGLPPGRHRVVTEQLGMTWDTVEVDLYGSEATALAVFTLETRPVELPGLRVTVERTFRNPRVAGFYQRMEKQRLGSYITREDLERRDIIGNFRRIPGVRVDRCGLFPGSNCWTLSFFGRGPLGGVLGPGTECREPLIYLDGHLLPTGLADGLNAFNILQQYPRHALEGIEVYRNPAMAPAQYRTLDAACGIVLVWTRDRRAR